MSRNNLIPERRTDKNGVTSTRWVKTGPAAPSAAGKLPMPGMTRESLQSRKDRLRETFDLGRMAGNENFLRVFKEQVDGIPESCVDLALKILDEYQDSPRVNYAVRASIQKWDKDDSPRKTEDYLRLSLRIAAVESFYEKHLEPSPLGNPSRAESLEEGIVASLVMSKGDGDDSAKRPLTAEETEIAVCGAYAAAAYDMHKTNIKKPRFFSSESLYWDMFQSYPELVGAFREFEDRLDEVAEYVYQNGSDASALRQHMRGDHMALAGGAL